MTLATEASFFAAREENQILRFAQDDRDRALSVILSEAKNLHLVAAVPGCVLCVFWFILEGCDEN